MYIWWLMVESEKKEEANIDKLMEEMNLDEDSKG